MSILPPTAEVDDDARSGVLEVGGGSSGLNSASWGFGFAFVGSFPAPSAEGAQDGERSVLIGIKNVDSRED